MAEDRSDIKKSELEHFNLWKKTQDPKHFQALYTSMKPLIYDAARKVSYGSNLPQSAHRAFAAQAFFDALRTYDPGKGTILSSHIYNSVGNKVKRLNYQYSNLGHTPEPRMQQVGLFNAEHSNLKAELNREPTIQELASRLGWSQIDVSRMHTELRKDLAMDEAADEHGFHEGNRDEETLHYLYFDLNPHQKTVYDHIFGKNGKPKMVKANGKIDFDGIARNMGVSSSKVRQIHSSIAEQMQKTMKR